MPKLVPEQRYSAEQLREIVGLGWDVINWPGGNSSRHNWRVDGSVDYRLLKALRSTVFLVSPVADDAKPFRIEIHWGASDDGQFPADWGQVDVWEGKEAWAAKEAAWAAKEAAARELKITKAKEIQAELERRREEAIPGAPELRLLVDEIRHATTPPTRSFVLRLFAAQSNVVLTLTVSALDGGGEQLAFTSMAGEVVQSLRVDAGGTIPSGFWATLGGACGVPRQQLKVLTPQGRVVAAPSAATSLERLLESGQADATGQLTLCASYCAAHESGEKPYDSIDWEAKELGEGIRNMKGLMRDLFGSPTRDLFWRTDLDYTQGLAERLGLREEADLKGIPVEAEYGSPALRSSLPGIEHRFTAFILGGSHSGAVVMVNEVKRDESHLEVLC